MRRILFVLPIAIFACHSDSVVDPITPPGLSDAKNMTVGETRVLVPSQLPNGIELSTSSATTDYLVIVANTSPALDVQASYVVRGNEASGDAPRFDVLQPSYAKVAGERGEDAQQAADGRIRAFERQNLVPANAIGGGSRLRKSIGFSAAVNVGDVVTVKVPVVTSAKLCDSFVTTKGIVRAISSRAIIVLDTAANQTAFTAADFSAIATEFDNVVYPTDSSYFGKPTDIDANGRVMLYYTPEVNKATPAGQQSFVAGFFFAGDFYPPTGSNSCAQSNQAEIFYLLAPDPLGKFNNVRSTNTVRQGTRGTIAHEFQHMINAGNRVVSGASAFESVWLDEGLAHFAEDAVGRAVRGFGDLQTLSDGDLFTADQTVRDAYNAFFFQNLKRFSSYLVRPDTASPLSKQAEKDLAPRGAIWALLRWSADNLSGSNPRAFTRRLAAGPDTGIKNLTAVAGAPLDTLISGWLITNFSDHTGIPNLPAKYNFVSYNMRSVIAGANSGAYPLLVTGLTPGAAITTTTLPGSGTYYKVTVSANTTRTVKIQDSGGANVTFPGAHFYVLRID